MSRRNSAQTERALEKIARGEMTPYAAAKSEGLHPGTVYRALKRERERASK